MSQVARSYTDVVQLICEMRDHLTREFKDMKSELQISNFCQSSTSIPELIEVLGSDACEEQDYSLVKHLHRSVHSRLVDPSVQFCESLSILNDPC